MLDHDLQITIKLLFGCIPSHYRSVWDIHAQLEKGLPAEVLHQLQKVRIFGDDLTLLAKVLGMTQPTLQRHFCRSEPLSPAQSCLAWRFAELLGQAEEVFGDRQTAERWLITPSLGLSGHVPIDLITTPVGARLVTELLTRIDYCVYT